MGVKSSDDPDLNRLWVLSTNEKLATNVSAKKDSWLPSIANIEAALNNRVLPALNNWPEGVQPVPFYFIIIGPATPGAIHLHHNHQDYKEGSRDDLTSSRLG